MSDNSTKPPGDLDIDLEFLDLDDQPAEAVPSPPSVGETPDIGLFTGKAEAEAEQQSFLRRSEEDEARLKAEREARMKKLMESEEDPVIVPKIETPEGEDEADQAVSFDEFKRAPQVSVGINKVDESAGNGFILFGFGAMAFAALMLYALIKLM